MIEQLKTIQENAERIAHNSTDDPRSCGYAILNALTQLEAMVREQQPVAWRDPSNSAPGQGCTYDKAVADKWPHIYKQPLYAAPVAQQPRQINALSIDSPITFGGCPFCGRQSCVAGQCQREPAAQQPQAKPHKPLFADLIAQHPGLREELLEMDKQPQAEAVRPTPQQIKAAWASPDLPLAPPTPIYNFVDRLFDAMQIKQAEAVPPGYVPVPVEPTDEMIQGFWGDITHGELEREAAKEAWRKAIDAAIAQQKGRS